MASSQQTPLLTSDRDQPPRQVARFLFFTAVATLIGLVILQQYTTSGVSFKDILHPAAAGDASGKSADSKEVGAPRKCWPPFGNLTLVYNSTYGLCTTLEGKPILWIYWDYSPMPAYIKLSIESIRCHNQELAHLQLVTDREFRDFLANASLSLHHAFQYLIPAHKADYFRCTVLLHFGGMYLDADTVQWSSLAEWFSALKQNDAFGYTWPGEYIGITVIGPLRANTTLMQFWQQDAFRLLDTKFPKGVHGDPLGWNELLGRVLQRGMGMLLNTSAIRYKSVEGPSTIGLMNGLFSGMLWSPAKWDSPTIQEKIQKMHDSKSPLFVYHNSPVGPPWRTMTSVDEFRKSKVALAQILDYTIGRCRNSSDASRVRK